MASILVDNKQNGDYFRLVESYRDVHGKSKIRTLTQLGKLDAKKIASLKKIADKLYRLVGVDIDQLPHTGIKEYYIHLASNSGETRSLRRATEVI